MSHTHQLDSTHHKVKSIAMMMIRLATVALALLCCNSSAADSDAAAGSSLRGGGAAIIRSTNNLQKFAQNILTNQGCHPPHQPAAISATSSRPKPPPTSIPLLLVNPPHSPITGMILPPFGKRVFVMPNHSVCQ